MSEGFQHFQHFQQVQICTYPDGSYHFANTPDKAIIDVYSIAFIGSWIVVDLQRKTVTLTLDGVEVKYQRVAKTLAGHWACERVR